MQACVRAVRAHKGRIVTVSLVVYLCAYLAFGIAGINVSLQPVTGYVRTASNDVCPSGAMWIESNDLHWCDGSTEYRITDESGDRITLVDGTSPGPSGAAWIEGSDLHWIDTDDDEYAYTGRDTGNDPSGSAGAAWIEGGWLHYIDENGNERVADTTPP